MMALPGLRKTGQVYQNDTVEKEDRGPIGSIVSAYVERQDYVLTLFFSAENASPVRVMLFLKEFQKRACKKEFAVVY